MTGSGTMQSPSSVTSRNIEDSQSPSQVTASIRAASPSQIKAILLADGWHDTQGCQLVHFALGESQSPVMPTNLYTYLAFTEEDREVYVPISAVLGYDISKSKTTTSGQSSSQR